MKNKKLIKNIGKNLGQFAVICLLTFFVISIFLPFTIASNSDGNNQSFTIASDSDNSSQSYLIALIAQGDSAKKEGFGASEGDATPTTTTTTPTPITTPQGKYIPISPEAYPDFPQLTSQEPVGIINEFAQGLIKNFSFILVTAGVLYIVIASIKLIMAGDKEEVVTKQRTAITYVIVGLAVIGFAGEFAKTFSVACPIGATDCVRGGFLSDPSAIIQQTGIFNRSVQIAITFLKWMIGSIAVLMLVRNGIRLVGLAGSEESITLDKKNIYFTSLGLMLIIVASIAIDKVLYVVDPTQYGGSGGVHPAVSPTSGLQELIGFTNFTVTFISPIAVLVLIVGGVMYATAGGNDERMGKAKKLIISAIIGMIFIYGAFAVVSTIVAGEFTP